MYPPSRSRRIAKWTGLAVCLLVGFAWAASTQWICAYRVRGLGAFGIYARHVGFLGESGARYYSVGWHVAPPVEPLAWLDYSPVVIKSGEYSIALWLLLAGTMLPTVILWRRDRGPREGHCFHCDYNLTGAEHEKCPECGARIVARPEARQQPHSS